jgi:YidC/Oxa1 family membrane protein insertase
VNENKNMLLAIVLSAIVLLGWGFVSETWFPTANPPATRIEKGREVPVAQPHADPAADSPRAMRDRQVVLAETPRVRIETPRLSGSINLKGARIDDLLLVTERETIARNSPPIRLFSPAGARDSYFAEFGWTPQEGLRGPDANTVWQTSGQRLTPSTPVTLRWNTGQGQTFEIRLAIDDAYLFTAEQRVINRGAGPIASRPYGLVSRASASHDIDGWTMHVGPMGVFNGAADYDNYYSDVVEGPRRFTSTGGWLGFTDKYWLAAIVPAQSSQVQAEFVHNARTNAFQADYTAAPRIVAPGRGHHYVSHLFAGAKEVELLETYSTTLATPIDKAIDWGWFEWFMRPIFALLVWLFAQIGNFGLSIIGLTIIVRLILFPVAQRQFSSMAKMRSVQPKMKALQERHADDRMKLQEEMMKLYKEEKVNPVAGCLPILLQIPIFYALYKVLLVAVEMRHEPFVLWIRDLSAPDPLSPINLFGYLPFTPPSFLAVGVLPIIVGVTMWIQMKLNPQMPDPVQRQVFALMPWVLMFVMAPFAAGLQLYWATNNILSIGQQRLLYMRHPSLKEPLPATGGLFGGGGSPPPPAPPSPPAPNRSKKKR